MGGPHRDLAIIHSMLRGQSKVYLWIFGARVLLSGEGSFSPFWFENSQTPSLMTHC